MILPLHCPVRLKGTNSPIYQTFFSSVRRWSAQFSQSAVKSFASFFAVRISWRLVRNLVFLQIGYEMCFSPMVTREEWWNWRRRAVQMSKARCHLREENRRWSLNCFLFDVLNQAKAKQFIFCKRSSSRDVDFSLALQRQTSNFIKYSTKRRSVPYVRIPNPMNKKIDRTFLKLKPNGHQDNSISLIFIAFDDNVDMRIFVDDDAVNRLKCCSCFSQFFLFRDLVVRCSCS